MPLIPNPIPAPPAFAPGLGRGAANLALRMIIQEMKAAIGAGASAAAVRGTAPNAACVQPRPFLEGSGRANVWGRGWRQPGLAPEGAVKSSALLLRKASEHVPRRHPCPAAPVAVLQTLQPRSSLRAGGPTYPQDMGHSGGQLLNP